MSLKHTAVLVVLPLAFACSSSKTSGNPGGNADGGTGIADAGTGLANHTISGCSPLAIGPADGGACVTPFPNAWFEENSTTNVTGINVSYPGSALPANNSRTGVEMKTFGILDGYSPATPLIAWFPDGVNSANLTPPENIESSLSVTNPIALVDLSTLQRVPFFSEIDQNGTGRHALLIHPMVRLNYSTRYAVAITTALQDGSGNALQPQGDFALWVAGTLPSSSPLSEISGRLDQDVLAFETLGIAKSSLALAWDFDTASDARTTGYLFGMVQEALQMYPKGSTYTLTPMPADADGNIVINGTFESPSFEAGPDPSMINYDATTNAPVMGAPASFVFTAIIPGCVASASAPVPIAIVGHGLFGNANEELTGDLPLFNQLCMVAMGADFLGVTDQDLSTVADALSNANQFGLVTDRLMQSHVNFQILTKLALNALATDPAFQVNGKASYDPTQIYYWGASNGGIQGATYLTLSGDVNRALLNVPGAEWSLLIFRSEEFAAAGIAFSAAYPDPLDDQILIGASQSLWDRSDPIEFATHLGTGKSALFQQSMGDPLVTNISTELEMRTIGAKGLAPLITPVYGVSADAAATDSIIYTQWSVDPMPMPTDADTPAADNPAHNAIRALPDAIQQMQDWLKPNGQAVNTCDGPASTAILKSCVYPGFGS